MKAHAMSMPLSEQEVKNLNLIGIDQSLTGTGIAMFHDGEYEIALEETQKKKDPVACPVCGNVLLNPNSSAHRSTNTHQEAASGLAEEEEEELMSTLDDGNSHCIENAIRIQQIRNRILALCKDRRIHYAIIEGMAFGTSGRGKFDLGGLFYSIIDVFNQLDIKYVIIPPTVAKKFWTGKGNASKEEMIEESQGRGIDIPFDYDDNCNDAFVFLVFLKKMLLGTIPEDMLKNVEISWKT